jgi:hypothetical protein
MCIILKIVGLVEKQTRKKFLKSWKWKKELEMKRGGKT